MRLGLVVYGSLDGRSGGYLYDRKFVEVLRGEGNVVEVLALPGGSYLHQLGDNFRSGLEAKVRAADLDLLLEDELCHPSLLSLNRRLRSSDHLPIVAIVHHLRSDESHPPWILPLYRAVEGAFLATADGFICNSRATRRSVRALGPRGRPIIVTPPGGDHLGPGLASSAVVARAHRPGPLQILFLGNLIPRKGLHVLLKALALLPAHSWRLTIAGDLDADAAYTARVRRLAVLVQRSGRIRFAGPLSPSQVAGELRRAQVLAVPSSHEGFGIAYLEGMAFGLPALASAHGGAAELVRDGYNGFLIKPGEVRILAERLDLLHRNRERLGRMGAAARRTFLKRPTWRRSVRGCARWMRRLARG